VAVKIRLFIRNVRRNTLATVITEQKEKNSPKSEDTITERKCINFNEKTQ